MLSSITNFNIRNNVSFKGLDNNRPKHFQEEGDTVEIRSKTIDEEVDRIAKETFSNEDYTEEEIEIIKT